MIAGVVRESNIDDEEYQILTDINSERIAEIVIVSQCADEFETGDPLRLHVFNRRHGHHRFTGLTADVVVVDKTDERIIVALKKE